MNRKDVREVSTLVCSAQSTRTSPRRPTKFQRVEMVFVPLLFFGVIGWWVWRGLGLLLTILLGGDG